MSNHKTNFFKQIAGDNSDMGATAHYLRFYLGNEDGFVNDFSSNLLLVVSQVKYRKTSVARMEAFCSKNNIPITDEMRNNYEPYYFLQDPHIIVYEDTTYADRDYWHVCMLRGEKPNGFGVKKRDDGNWDFFRVRPS